MGIWFPWFLSVWLTDLLWYWTFDAPTFCSFCYQQLIFSYTSPSNVNKEWLVKWVAAVSSFFFQIFCKPFNFPTNATVFGQQLTSVGTPPRPATNDWGLLHFYPVSTKLNLGCLWPKNPVPRSVIKPLVEFEQFKNKILLFWHHRW